ncbi:nodal homolog [Argopecten irradians]|uniref:nodal homolog n=1 Tax=Argopecten irradians TaxID=31199 RepID=UPI00371B8B0E
MSHFSLITILTGLLMLYISEVMCEEVRKSESSEFLLGVYQHLLKGGTLETASGHGRRTIGVMLSDTIRSVHSKGVISQGNQHELYFRIPKRDYVEQFHQVEIRIKTEQLQSLKKRITLKIRKNGVDIRKMLFRHKSFQDGADSVWDVTSFVRPWINNIRGTLDVRLGYQVPAPSTVKTRVNILKRLTDYENIKAVLVLFSKDKDILNARFKQDGMNSFNDTDNNGTIRTRRSTKKSNRTNRKRKLCQVKDFEVDFNTIGWGKWIVHPKHFNAKVCVGICPSPIKDSLSPSNHAMLQGMMRANTRGRKRKVSMPCCVPTKLKPQSMLYYEGNELVVRHHNDMVVDECGCR